MTDPEQARVEELIIATLRTQRGGADVTIQPHSGGRPVVLQWPPPLGMFALHGVPEVVPTPQPGAAPRVVTPAPPPPPTVAIDPHQRGHEAKGGVSVGDFSKVTWPGTGTFLLNAKQAAVVRLLYEGWMDGIPEVRETVLLATAHKAGSDAVRLRDVFRHNPAFGHLVIPGRAGGTYQLAPLPEDEEG